MTLTNTNNIDKKNPFRNSMNQRYLKGLFYETQVDGLHKATVYTLKDWDHKGYPSLYRLYMESNDPTEWSFATKHLDGFEHWEMLCHCTWFKPIVARWRKELELKLRSEALVRVLEEAKDAKSKSKFTANRFLLEKGWVNKNTKGRPSKDDIKQEAQRIFNINQRLKEDEERLGLTSSNGIN